MKHGPQTNRRKFVTGVATLGGGFMLGMETQPGPQAAPTLLVAGLKQFPTRVALPVAAEVTTGAQILASRDFDILKGKRVGLVTNHTGMVGDQHLADLLGRGNNTKLGAIFVPEHGFRGRAEAGASIENSINKVTRVPIFSLFGSTLKPTPEMLRTLDVIVFDIQDLGVRFYTYISTMGLAMQAAAAARIPFVVLDRPNPLGGEYVSGYVLEAKERSFIGQYEIPIAHGLTVGDLARMIRGEQLISGVEQLNLTVLPMNGWQRWMRWPDTKLNWVRTSPNIVSFETAVVYPGAGFFEATSASEGRGTLTPFTVLGAPWVNGSQLAERLNAENLPGVLFEPTSFVPLRIEGMASNPRFIGQTVQGIRIVVTDFKNFLPVETGIHLLQAFQHEAEMQNAGEFVTNAAFFNKLAGSPRLYESLNKHATTQEIIDAWQRDVTKYKTARLPYLLY